MQGRRTKGKRKADLIHIGATIYVERDSQKGIVIGAGGALLKPIGQHARGNRSVDRASSLSGTVGQGVGAMARESPLRQLGLLE